MKILILGANGRVGSKVAALLLVRGHSVVAAVHSSDSHVPSAAQTLHVDITDYESVIAALNGCDGVVCALSSWNAPKHDVLASAMKVVVPAMETAGVRRIISISGDVARLAVEQVPLPVKLFHVVALGAIRQIVTDSEKHIQLLNDSTLEWTVLRPGIMTSTPRGDYTLQLTHPLRPTIPRAAVVESIADLIESHSYIRKAPYIVRS